MNGRETFLGSFSTELAAALAYDNAARAHFGCTARTNFPDFTIDWAMPYHPAQVA